MVLLDIERLVLRGLEIMRRSLHLAIEHRASRALIGNCALYAFTGQRGGTAAAMPRAGSPVPAWGEAHLAASGATLGYLPARLGFRSAGAMHGHWNIDGRPCDVEAFVLERGALSVRERRCA